MDLIKKTICAILAVMLLSGVLTACASAPAVLPLPEPKPTPIASLSPDTAADDDALIDVLDALTQSVNDMQQKIYELEGKWEGAKPSPSPSPTEALSDDGSVKEADSGIADLKTLVRSVSSKIESAVPEDGRGAKISQYMALRAEIDAAEREIDAFGDKLKSAYFTGSFTFEDYRELDKKLISLKALLDNAMDALERKLNLDG